MALEQLPRVCSRVSSTRAMKKKYSGGIAAFFLAIVLVASLLSAVTFGSTKIPVSDVYGVIMHKLGMSGEAPANSISDVVWLIRLPRLVLAVAVGAGLSVSGVVMQAVVRNPLADPYALGVSSGAYLGASMAILLGMESTLGGNAAGIMAFVGAFSVSILVALIGGVGGQTNTVRLLLTGMAVSSVCTAFSNFLIYRTQSSERVQAVVLWMLGGLGAAKWATNTVALTVIFLCFLFFWSQFRSLNLMLLGDEAAVALGVDSRRRRVLYMLVSSLMVGFSVYCAGMIGFIGLVIPHVVRMLFGSDHRRLIPLCALSGSIFLIWADVLCRIVIKGAELPIGILTAMIGSPFFVYLMSKRKYSFGGQR